MSADNQESKSKQDEKTALTISAKKYSTIADFLDDFDKDSDKEKQVGKKKTEEEIKKQEEAAKEKENEEKTKQDLLNHWSKILVKEPPKRRTCHTSFIHDSYLYVIGGIDITEQKQDDIYKVNLQEKNTSWKKIEPLGDRLGRIAYHAGAELNGYYYIVGGQDENLNTLNSIIIFDITQEKCEKLKNVELEVTIQDEGNKQLELLRKLLIVIRAKIKDKIDSDRIESMETELEKELLQFMDQDELISKEKNIIEELNLPNEDYNKLMETNLNLDKIEIASLSTTFSQTLINGALEAIKEKLKILPPRLESHTVNAIPEQNKLIIYGGMSGKDYNRHVYEFDTQVNKYKNLTEQLDKTKTPPPRQDHAAVLYNGSLYVYGGIGPDSKIYDDMWKFDLSTNTWEEIKTEQQRNKEEKRKQKLAEKQANNEDIETEDDEDDDLEEDESNKDVRPKARSGHSMVLVGDMFYIFGGKTGLIKESNEIWEFNPNDCVYSCVHETLLEQFTKEELKKISAENQKDDKKFKWLTRSEVEKRTNPSFNDNKSEKDKEKAKKNQKKQKENEKKSPEKKKDAKKPDKSKKKKNTKKIDKIDNKTGQNKDIEGKYADQVLCRPNVVKMRKTLIFTSDPEKIKEGLNTLSQDEKEKLNQNVASIKGELPEPRDGQTVCVDGTNMYLFGGDRFKFPFNDLFVLDTNQLPRLKIKESTVKKKEKEREREEKERRIQEKKEKEEEEEREKERIQQIKDGTNIDNKNKNDIKEEDEENGENPEDAKNDNDNNNKTKDDTKKGDTKKDDTKKDDTKKDDTKKDDTKKDDSNTKKADDAKKNENECPMLREILQY